MKFETFFLRKSGEEFQDFFADLMEKRYGADFERTRPQGALGDYKTDGILRSQEAIFQVYAPRSRVVLKKLLEKIETDFQGALRHHGKNLRQWIFVHNDFKGLPVEVYEKFEQFRRLYPYLSFEAWGEGRLWKLVEEMPGAELLALFGAAPTQKDFDVLGFEEVAQVVEVIRTQPLEPDSDEIAEVPRGKLEANSLSEATKVFLSLGWQRARLVEQYFARHRNPAFGEEVARVFRREYRRLRLLGFNSDQIFLQLQTFISGATRGDAEHEAAVLTVLAYFFEACDIFEPHRQEV